MVLNFWQDLSNLYTLRACGITYPQTLISISPLTQKNTTTVVVVVAAGNALIRSIFALPTLRIPSYAVAQ